jgi:iron(III) transport system ATP-binding protein
MDNFVEIRNLVKVFAGGIKAVDNISFSVKMGKILSLLGPSGCGKTTTLRCIAGLERPDKGEITIDGVIYDSVEKGITVLPHKRNIGMVFQSYAVWPHMNVFDNVAYGLRIQKVKKIEKQRRVEEILDLVGLHGLANRQVTKLSGGQQQRVAVARALVYNPRLLLFDEPLSNLDAKLRERMRLELIRLQREIGITSIYVTHDQIEAMVISDEIVVMDSGRIAQIGNAVSIYDRPRNKFVADFIGIANFLDAEVLKKMEGSSGLVKVYDGTRHYEMKSVMSEDVRGGDRVTLFFRPEDLRIIAKPKGDEANILEGEILALVYLGNYIDCRIKVGMNEIRAQISKEESIKVHQRVLIEIVPERCVCIRR